MSSSSPVATSNGGEAAAAAAAPSSSSIGGHTFGSNVHISQHPVLSHKISLLRSSSTTCASFRSLMREITFHLGYEATSTLKTKPVELTVPIGSGSGSGSGSGNDNDNNNGDCHLEYTGTVLAERAALIPILRSGLGMTDPMLELLPKAGVHHIGMYRKRDLFPVQYYNRLPRKCDCDVAYVLDPLVATSATLMSVVGILKKWGVPKIHVIAVVASPEGIRKMASTHPDVMFHVGAVDEKVDEHGNLVPGVGDSGDRLYGTDVTDDPEALLHPSKRKRSDA